MRGDEDAAAVGAVGPAMVGTLEAVAVDDAAERQARAAMHAQVAPRTELVPGAPDHDVLTQQPGRDRAASFEVYDPGHRVPVVDEDGVIEHRGQRVVSRN